jgi:hypothetical protein
VRVIATVGTDLVSAMVRPRYKRRKPCCAIRVEKISPAGIEGVNILLRRKVSMGKQTDVDTAPDSKPIVNPPSVVGDPPNHSLDK